MIRTRYIYIMFLYGADNHQYSNLKAKIYNVNLINKGMYSNTYKEVLKLLDHYKPETNLGSRRPTTNQSGVVFAQAKGNQDNSKSTNSKGYQACYRCVKNNQWNFECPDLAE